MGEGCTLAAEGLPSKHSTLGLYPALKGVGGLRQPSLPSTGLLITNGM